MSPTPDPKSDSSEADPTVSSPTKWTIGIVVAAVSVVALIVATFTYATDIVLILFLGLLFGVFLHRANHGIKKLVPLAYSWCLALTTTLFLVTVAGGFFLFGYQISQQVEQASDKIRQGVNRLQELADNNSTVRSVIDSTPFVNKFLLDDLLDSNSASDSKKSSPSDTSQTEPESASDSKESSRNDTPQTESESAQPDPSKKSAANASDSSLLKGATQRVAEIVGGIFQTTLGLIVNSLLIFFVGLFIATDPEMYRDGFVRLFPVRRRQRAREIMDHVGDTLWHWLLGRFGSMLITGVGAGLILWMLGVPMAFSLGIVTGMLTFIPNIGAAIAFVLSFLVALSQGVSPALWLIPGYLGLQLLESYVVTPLIQQRQVSIPPALLLAFQALLGILFGFLGAAVASPMLAAAKVTIEEAYIKDILEE